jgi:hypothetical protein
VSPVPTGGTLSWSEATRDGTRVPERLETGMVAPLLSLIEWVEVDLEGVDDGPGG